MWNFINDIINGTGSAVSSININPAEQFKYSKKLMDYQNKLNVKNYKNRHQWEIQDLQSAGLNPILSVTGSTAGSLPSVGLSNAPDVASIGEKRANTAMAISRFGKELQQIRANIDNTKADSKLKDAMAGTEIYKQGNLSADSSLKALQSVAQSIQNSQLPAKLKAELEEINARTQNYIAQGQASTAMAYNGYMQNMITQEHYANMDWESKKFREWAEKHPNLYSVDKGIQKHSGTIGAGIGTALGAFFGTKKYKFPKFYR